MIGLTISSKVKDVEKKYHIELDTDSEMTVIEYLKKEGLSGLARLLEND